ncbi:response regulator [Paenibacillus sp. CF384]|uniref:response regulator n=1 Tax=Paenibacillus sp. CF384 TaxID=1884382 RepID=UPI000895C6AD|nr:response regulator [Paenibacillus sp. CF384]SDW08956.1 diguanylate cyclase (GGDEF) domain-containing protein [Paenibacillus sp. CF384]
MDEFAFHDYVKASLSLEIESKQKYLEELKQQLDVLNDPTNKVGYDELIEQARERYRIGHTIKGTAPILGMGRMGRVAAQFAECWEWSYETNSLTGNDVHNLFQDCCLASLPLVQELGMEFEINCKELLMEQKQAPFKEVLPPQLLGSRLLVVDDDRVLRSYLSRKLRLEGYKVDEASNVETAIKLLKENDYQLITLDLMMHPQSGYEIFEVLKEDPMIKWLPMLVLSGRNDMKDVVRCFRMGADDFVTKPFDYGELSARIQRMLLRHMEFALLAFNDPLTGIHNRRYFDLQLQVEVNRVQKYNEPLTLVIIDIDFFKEVNDRHGHPAGDLVLQKFAHLLQSCLRNTDILARVGGEEFGVILPGITELEAEKIMNRILQRVRSEPIAQHDIVDYCITFSAGIASWNPSKSIQNWFQVTDYALYKAKHTGRNRVVRTSFGMAKKNLAGLELQADEPKTILIADDDRMLRMMIADQFRKEPYKLIEAQDGETAYRILVEQQPDICILDCIMPGMSGFEVLERMRTEGTRAAKTQIILLSGRSSEEDVHKGLELGADAYMFKPFSLIDVEMKVSKMLFDKVVYDATT